MASTQRTAPNPLMVSSLKESDSLEMTDYFFLFGLFLMLWWAIDPLLWGLDNIPGVKRLPSLILGMNLAFIVVGRALFSSHRKGKAFSTVVMENRFLLMFSAFIVLGSLYAKFKNGIDETFLTMGVYIWVAPIAHWYTINSRAPQKLLKAILSMYILWAVVALAIQFVMFRKAEIFHNREHLILPIVGALIYYLPWRISRFMTIAVIVLGTIAVSKITAFIVAVITLSYLLGLSVYRRVRYQKDSLNRFFALVAGILIVSLVVGGSVIAYYTLDASMPSGNSVYRLHTYKIAWDKFVASPLWGHAFTKSAVIEFDLFVVAAQTQNLPTHSDPLDILAGGGIIAAGLWLWGVFSKLIPAFFEVSVAGKSLPWRDELVHQALLLAVFCALIVCTFNPIYNVPNLATANWLAFGCLLTSTQLCKAKLASGS